MRQGKARKAEGWAAHRNHDTAAQGGGVPTESILGNVLPKTCPSQRPWAGCKDLIQECWTSRCEGRSLQDRVTSPLSQQHPTTTPAPSWSPQPLPVSLTYHPTQQQTQKRKKWDQLSPGPLRALSFAHSDLVLDWGGPWGGPSWILQVLRSGVDRSGRCPPSSPGVDEDLHQCRAEQDHAGAAEGRPALLLLLH